MLERDKFFEQRLEKADALREEGKEPYANDFRVDTKVVQFLEKYAHGDKEALADITTEHAVAGRVMAGRGARPQRRRKRMGRPRAGVSVMFRRTVRGR